MREMGEMVECLRDVVSTAACTVPFSLWHQVKFGRGRVRGAPRCWFDKKGKEGGLRGKDIQARAREVRGDADRDVALADEGAHAGTVETRERKIISKGPRS